MKLLELFESMETLQDAIEDLKLQIEDGINSEEALAISADDYELNPVLLRRKFEEQTHVDITGWDEFKNQQDVALTSRDEAGRNKATQALDRYTLQFDWPDRIKKQSRYGKSFMRNDIEYLYCVYATRGRSGRIGRIHAIKVSDSHQWRFWGDKQIKAIHKQVDDQIEHPEVTHPKTSEQ